MRTKVTLILIFLNVALFGFIFYVRPKFDIEEKIKATRTRVLGPESADIQSLTLVAGPQTTALARRGEAWSITAPFNWPANPHAVSSILKELQLLEHETSFLVADLPKTGMTLADYGLDHPAASIAFTTTATPTPVTLQLGKGTTDGNRLYILSPDGERIHVVNRRLATLLATPPEQLRSDELLSIPVFEVRSFNLQNAANLRIRVRRDGDRWAFETPIDARASKTATELTIAGLAALRAKTFITEPLAPELTPSSSASLRITLEGNNRSETLLLGAPRSTPAADATEIEFYAQIEKSDYKSVVFTVSVPKPLLDQLSNAQKALRETHLYSLDPRTVTSIALRAPRQPELTLQRVDASGDTITWQSITRSGEQASPSQPADAGLVRHLIDNLNNLTAAEFLSDAPSRADEEAWGFNQPEREIVVTTTGSTTQTTTLRIGVGANRGSTAYAQFSDAHFVYAIDAEILRKVPVEPRAWRNRILRELPAGARITALAIIPLGTPDAAPLYQRQLDGAQTWDEALAAEPADRQSAIRTLLAQLRQLRAKNFAGDHFTATVATGGPERPWSYKLVATVALEGGAAGGQTSTQEILLSDRIGGTTQLAGAQDLDALFEIEQPFTDALWTLIYGPRDPGPASTPPAPATAATP
ncbi:MAG TPA: DUF4340 domain-containing protein [Opitutaceae bacterium]|nr:DUF4340 domain-containing protein [Opitutaceae bacterium]